MVAKTGRCLCGAVCFSATDAELRFGACHCRMCQQWAGGPFLATSTRGVRFEDDKHLVRHQSSDWAERGFCARCGSALFYKVLASDAYEMCIGAFDDTDGFVLDSEIFVDRKPDAYAFAGDHERLTEAETIARYKDYGPNA
jgi:hypothetical protein